MVLLVISLGGDINNFISLLLELNFWKSGSIEWVSVNIIRVREVNLLINEIGFWRYSKV